MEGHDDLVSIRSPASLPLLGIGGPSPTNLLVARRLPKLDDLKMTTTTGLAPKKVPQASLRHFSLIALHYPGKSRLANAGRRSHKQKMPNCAPIDYGYRSKVGAYF